MDPLYFFFFFLVDLFRASMSLFLNSSSQYLNTMGMFRYYYNVIRLSEVLQQSNYSRLLFRKTIYSQVRFWPNFDHTKYLCLSKNYPLMPGSCIFRVLSLFIAVMLLLRDRYVDAEIISGMSDWKLVPMGTKVVCSLRQFMGMVPLQVLTFSTSPSISNYSSWMSSYYLRWSLASCWKLMDSSLSDTDLLGKQLETGSLSLSSSIWLLCICYPKLYNGDIILAKTGRPNPIHFALSYSSSIVSIPAISPIN